LARHLVVGPDLIAGSGVRVLGRIATVSDQYKTLIEQNTELTAQVHALVQQRPKAAPVKRLATPAEGGNERKPS
jgi:hypothetical protein